ncbi:MAG: hypothetical protein FJ386_01470 [Verrucomicrobia bacterium]|nr:hypothetical protein [Verrucomicrobiota bacterium]
MVALVAVALSLDGAVKKGVETFGPKIARVDVKLAGVSLSPMSGSGKLTGLVIGNPEGFKTPHAIAVGEVEVTVKPGSIFSDKIVVQKVNVVAPDITLEGGGKGSNLGKILENVQAATASEKSEPSSKPGKKLQVDEFRVTGGKINLSLTLLGGKSLTVPLPDIHLQNLGQGADGITPAELTEKMFSAVFTGTIEAAGQAVAKLGKAGAEFAAEVGRGVLDTAKAVGKGAVEGVKEIGKGIGNLFNK